MIPVNMILSLDQGPKWQARWDDGKVQGDDTPPPQPAPAGFLRRLAVLKRMTMVVVRTA